LSSYPTRVVRHSFLSLCTHAAPCFIHDAGSGLNAATIAALSTVAAALIAAAVAFGNELRKTGLRRIGIARLVEDDMRRRQSTLTRAWCRNRWWDAAEMLQVRASTKDMQLIAATLRVEDWIKVSSAVGWTETVIAIRDHNPDVQALSDYDRALLRNAWERLEDARHSLQTVSTPSLYRALHGGRPDPRLWKPHKDDQIREGEMQRQPEQADQIDRRGRIRPT